MLDRVHFKGQFCLFLPFSLPLSTCILPAMEVVYSSETSVPTYQSSLGHNPQDHIKNRLRQETSDLIKTEYLCFVLR
jgi:hypothetical protein